MSLSLSHPQTKLFHWYAANFVWLLYRMCMLYNVHGNAVTKIANRKTSHHHIAWTNNALTWWRTTTIKKKKTKNIFRFWWFLYINTYFILFCFHFPFASQRFFLRLNYVYISATYHNVKMLKDPDIPKAYSLSRNFLFCSDVPCVCVCARAKCCSLCFCACSWRY